MKERIKKISLILVCLDLASCTWPDPPPRCPEIEDAVLQEECDGCFIKVALDYPGDKEQRNYTPGNYTTVYVTELKVRNVSFPIHILLTAVLVDLPELSTVEPDTPEALLHDSNTTLYSWLEYWGTGLTRCVRPNDTMLLTIRSATLMRGTMCSWYPNHLAGLAGGVVFVANTIMRGKYKKEMMIKTRRLDSAVIKNYSEPTPNVAMETTPSDHVSTSTATTSAQWHLSMSAESWFYLCTIVASHAGFGFAISLLVVS